MDLGGELGPMGCALVIGSLGLQKVRAHDNLTFVNLSSDCSPLLTLSIHVRAGW